MHRDPALEHLNRRMRAMDRRVLMRPMNVGEIIDTSVRACRVLGRTFLRLIAGPMLLCLLVLAFFFTFISPGLFTTSDPNSLSRQIGEVIFVIAVGCFVALPLFVIGLSYSCSLITRLVSDFMLGNKPEESAAVKLAKKSLVPLIRLNFRSMLGAFLGLILTALLLLLSAYLDANTEKNEVSALLVSAAGFLGIFVSPIVFALVLFRHSLAPVICVLEGLSPKEAIKRSAQLLRAQAPHSVGYDSVLGIALVTFLVFCIVPVGLYAGSAAIGLTGTLTPMLGYSLLGRAIVSALAMLPWYAGLCAGVPIWCTAVTILYFDRRIRLEGYDIDVLAQDVRRSSKQSRFQL